MSHAAATFTFLATLILGLAASVPVTAQEPTGLTLTVEAPEAPITPGSTATLSVSVTVGCADILIAASGDPGGASHAEVTGTGPEWLTVQESEVEFSPDACVGATTGSVTEEGTVTVTAAANAPGLEDAEVTLTATLQGREDASDSAIATVSAAYAGSVSVSANPASSIPVGAGPTKVNITITVSANAQTMVMFSLSTSPEFGNITGLPVSRTYDSPLASNKSETVEIITLTYEATGAWTTDEASISVIAHAVADTSSTASTNDLDLSFASTSPADAGDDGSGNDAPFVSSPVLGVGLVAFVALLRRRIGL